MEPADAGSRTAAERVANEPPRPYQLVLSPPAALGGRGSQLEVGKSLQPLQDLGGGNRPFPKDTRLGARQVDHGGGRAR